jgi:hypothetical protein
MIPVEAIPGLERKSSECESSEFKYYKFDTL